MQGIRRSFIVLITAFCAFAAPAAAQTGGSIEGTVTDTTGGALPGATVTITNTQMGLSRTLVTDAEGRYRARDLGLGDYRVEASLEGFQTSVREGVVLTIGREAVVDFQLTIGQLTESILVSGDAPLVNTTSAAIGMLVAREQMADLPLNARDFSQLITLQAGTVHHRGEVSGSNAGQSRGARIAISGARPSANVFVLDGTEIQTAYGHLPAGVGGATLGLEAVQEFQVLTSTYSAQRGRSVGGTVVAVTRSGSNDLRGSAYWYYRNDALDARNFFDRGEKPDFTRNQFGGGIGGPILRNRTFFFANLEMLRERLPLRLAGSVPTAAAREGSLPNRTVTVHPAVRPYLALYPLPDGRDLGDGTAEYFRSADRPLDQTYASLRVDHQFNSNRSIFGRYTRDVSDLIDPLIIPLVDDSTFTRNHYATIQSDQVFSSRLANQLRVAYTRATIGGDQLPVNLPDASLSHYAGRPFGTITVPGVSTLRVAPQVGPGQDTVNATIIGDDATFDTGRHSIHFGGAFTALQFNRISHASAGGVWQFGSLVDFLQNAPPNRLLITGFGADPERLYRQRLLTLYVQDDIRMNSKLTLNIGMRYEYMTPPTEAQGRLSNLRGVLEVEPTVGEPFYENPGGFFSPRLGVVWDPTGNGRTSLRTGFGVFHQPLMMRDYAIAMTRQPPFWSDVDPPANQLAGLFPDLNPHLERLSQGPQAIQFFEFRPNNPYSLHASLSVQQQLAANLVVEVGYTGTRGIHLIGRKEWHVPPRTVVDGETFYASSDGLINPNHGRLNYYDTSSSSWYHGLRATVTRRFAAGLHFQAAYTWSKAMDINSATLAGELGETVVSDPYDPTRDWAPADFDARHVFTGSVSYQLPWGEGLSGVTGVLAGGWQVSGIFSAVAGNPFSVLSNSQLTHRLLRVGAQRPDLMPGGNNNPIRGGAEQYFDPMQFLPQRPGFLGSVGRNTLIGPGMAKLDVSVIKTVPLGGERRVQVRVEAFNVLNRVNLGEPASTLFNARGARLGTAGRITRTSTTARQMQLALRFEF